MMLTTRDVRVQQIVRNRGSILAEKKEESRRRANPHRPFSDVIKDGAWRGEACFIIGGGPSLIGFDFERLKNRGKIIAINRAFEHVAFADILFFMDSGPASFYKMLKGNRYDSDSFAKWNDFKGFKVHLNLTGRKLDDVYSVRSSGREGGISFSLRTGLYHGNNSGIGAIGLAIVLQANPIYLLGYDGGFTKGKSHFHTGYPRTMNESIFRSFIKDFIKFSELAKKTRYEIYNLNQESKIKCFKFKSIDEVLN